jgi:malate dehydrogenase (oxaloacetate-decarboxylating)
MARDPIVFACANPTPEIWPEDARRAGAAITATGRSDFPNQVNNALIFPGLFRGVLDVRASRISDAVALAAATALAAQACKNGLSPDRLLPKLDDADAAAAVAGAAAGAAMSEGVAKLTLAPETVVAQTRLRIAETRAAAAALFATKA